VFYPFSETFMLSLLTVAVLLPLSLLSPAGVKIGKFCVSAPGQCDPDNLDRAMTAADTEPLAAALRNHMPKAHGDILNFATCMFTMTPDNHFVIDTHPRHPQVMSCFLTFVL
jgi:glycine/D-amino acid oxidase-like deaminating enzyme